MEFTKLEFATLVKMLHQENYREGAPPGGDIDRDTVSAERCPDCGGPLTFRPFCKPGSYRAFAVCPKCGAYEF